MEDPGKYSTVRPFYRFLALILGAVAGLVLATAWFQEERPSVVTVWFAAAFCVGSLYAAIYGRVPTFGLRTESREDIAKRNPSLRAGPDEGQSDDSGRDPLSVNDIFRYMSFRDAVKAALIIVLTAGVIYLSKLLGVF